MKKVILKKDRMALSFLVDLPTNITAKQADKLAKNLGAVLRDSIQLIESPGRRFKIDSVSGPAEPMANSLPALLLKHKLNK